MNPKFKEGDLVEFVEYIPRLHRLLHLHLHLHPRLPRLHPRLENTLGIILKQLPPEEVWYDWAELSEAQREETTLKPENNCYVWFSQQELKEFAVFENELKEVKCLL